MKKLKSTCKWYCSNCGTKTIIVIDSVVPDNYDGKIDKQELIKYRCLECGQEFLVYRNTREVVQVYQRTEPTVTREEIKNDSI